MRDLYYIPALNQAGEDKFIEAKSSIKGESEKKKDIYIKQEVDIKTSKGINPDEAEKIVKTRLSGELDLKDSIYDNDGNEIIIEEILNSPETFNGRYIFDPIEPEKGRSKAVINSPDKENISIYSFLDGGKFYKIVNSNKLKQFLEKTQTKEIKIKQFSNVIIEKLEFTGEFNCNNIVEQILSTDTPITSYYADLYLYLHGFWQKHENEDIEKKIFIKACIQKVTGKRPTKGQIDAVHRELLMEYIDMPITQEVLINFNDGILKIKNGNYEQILHNPEYRKLYKLGFSYDPTATCPLTDKFCHEVMGDQDTVNLFFEFIGSCFISNDYFKLEKALFLYGSGSNGKSVLLDLLRFLFGSMNISTVALKDMSTPERRHSMVGKLLNIAAEGSSNKFDSEDFKAIVTREPLPVRVMYDNAIDTDDFPRLIFATNNLPYSGGDISLGVLRRMTIINFDLVIAEKDQDKQLLEKLKPELPGVMNRVLEGMMRLLKNGNLTKSVKVEKALEKYEMQINPVKYFIDELSLIVSTESKIYCNKKLYSKFQSFCIEVGIHTMNKRNFNNMMKDVFGEIQHSNNLYGWRIVEKNSDIDMDSSPYI